MINFWQRKPRFNSNSAAIDNELGPSTTYSELHTLAETINIMLPKEKQLVALLCTNSAHCLAGYLAALKGGHTVMLLDGNANAAQLIPLLKAYMPNYVWKPQHWGKPNVTLCKEYSLMPFNETPHQLNPDLAMLLPLPEAGAQGLMRFSYQNIQHQAETVAEFFDFREDTVAISALPMFSSAGIGLLNAFFHRGACQLFTSDNCTNESYWEFSKSGQANLFVGNTIQVDEIIELGFAVHLPKSIIGVLPFGALYYRQEWFNKFKALRSVAEELEFHLLFKADTIGFVSGLLAGEFDGKSVGSLGRPLPLTRLEVIDHSSELKIKEANVTGNLKLRSLANPMGPATEVADLALSDIFEGNLSLNCIGYFSETGHYFVSEIQD
jgi:acyl-CoA synthetase (AMP-forming)/AMP-acid ligase II